MALNIFDPTVYPYYRVQTYSDDIAPPSVLSEEFYNPTQDDVAALYGGLLGVTASMASEEFDRESLAAVTAGAQIGEQLAFETGTNANAFSTSPIADGDHGIWRVQSFPAAGVFETIIWDNPVFTGARQLIWAARVRFVGSTNFATVGNRGVVIGLWGAASSNEPAFRWGNNAAGGEWLAYYDAGAGDVFLPTGVTLTDDKWYNLFITRKSSDNKIRYYISTETDAPVLVATSTVAVPTAFSFCRRHMQVNGTGASVAGDGFYIDYFKRGVER